MTSFWFVRLQLADRIFILPEGVFSAQLFNSYRTTRLTRGFGIQAATCQKWQVAQFVEKPGCAIQGATGFLAYAQFEFAVTKE